MGCWKKGARCSDLASQRAVLLLHASRGAAAQVRAGNACAEQVSGFSRFFFDALVLTHQLAAQAPSFAIFAEDEVCTQGQYTGRMLHVWREAALCRGIFSTDRSAQGAAFGAQHS